MLGEAGTANDLLPLWHDGLLLGRSIRAPGPGMPTVMLSSPF